MNAQLVVGVALNSILTLIVSLSHGTLVLAIAGLPLVVSYFGLALIASGNRALGAKLALYSSALFVPLGMVAVLGARRVIDELERERFEARRLGG